MKMKAKILLVDDDEDFVEATKMALESKNYDVIVSVNGDDGLKKARSEKPDLILLDVIMPGKDGFTTAELMKKDDVVKKIPVLMLTSYAARGGGTGIPRSKGMELEADDYIDKTVSPSDILARVEMHLAKIGK
jgi:DNA-binding response OmpR family regulator